MDDEGILTSMIENSLLNAFCSSIMMKQLNYFENNQVVFFQFLTIKRGLVTVVLSSNS